jgi:hypothetical protein
MLPKKNLPTPGKSKGLHQNMEQPYSLKHLLTAVSAFALPHPKFTFLS